MIEAYRDLSQELLLVLLRFNLTGKFYMDKTTHTARYSSDRIGQAIWVLKDRSGKNVCVAAYKKVPNLKTVKAETERSTGFSDLVLLDALEPVEFDKKDLKKITGDAEIVGRYVTKLEDVFCLCLAK